MNPWDRETDSLPRTAEVPRGIVCAVLNIPLNPDIWTDYTIALANTPTLSNTKATLDALVK